MTAVEWLLENLMSEPYSEQDFKYNSECWDKALEMEKEQMEKEQITNAYIECWENDGGNGFHKVDEAEQYYNRTFKSE